VLTHPFLDTFEAIELARRKTAAAELARQAQERESDEERLRLAAEAAAQYETSLVDLAFATGTVLGEAQVTMPGPKPVPNPDRQYDWER
jgi:hypothetical protein